MTTFEFIKIHDEINLEVDSQTQAVVDTVLRMHQQGTLKIST